MVCGRDRRGTGGVWADYHAVSWGLRTLMVLGLAAFLRPSRQAPFNMRSGHGWPILAWVLGPSCELPDEHRSKSPPGRGKAFWRQDWLTLLMLRLAAFLSTPAPPPVPPVRNVPHVPRAPRRYVVVHHVRTPPVPYKPERSPSLRT